MSVRCRVCDGDGLDLFLDLGDQPHCDSLLRAEDLARPEPVYPLQVFFCPACTTVQLGYTVPKEVMFSEYLYVSGTTEALRAHFRESAQRLVRGLALTPGDLVVDIGSNDGTWLACFQEHGLRALGVESAGNIAALANARGVETVNRFFNEAVAMEIIASRGRPRLVTAAGVFFHLEELHSVTRGIAACCAEGGVFCVQAIYLGNIVGQTQFDNIYHEHLTYWSLRSLEALLGRHGLEVFAVSRLPIHGGTLEAWVATKGSRSVDASVERLRREERARGLGELDTYRAFADRVWKVRAALDEILGRETNRGAVHAFGAPAKGATLLNSFKITVRTIPCAVERNPLKFGRYIPGARIPILDEATVADPLAYLVLPWNFLPEFLVKKRDYLLHGGRFIVPIPFPVVIDRSNVAAYAPAAP